jgi:hypothetical protein
MSGIAPKQNAFKFKIAPHKQKYIVKKNSRKMGPLANGAHLSTMVNPTLNMISCRGH